MPGSDSAPPSVEPAAPPPLHSAAHATGIAAESVPDGICPNCGVQVDFSTATPLSMTTCSACSARILTPGRLDDFLLLDRIGEGEMGEIYRARDESLHREVAIKVVRATRADDDSLRERLRQEARAAARLSHPRVAQVHALGFSGGHPYLVMELVRGEDMEARLAREGSIDERDAMQAALDVTDGLRALHREGLTHGDIKPANIVLDREGRAKLVDFGLSGMSRRDSSGAILGTPHYIAPESLRGAPDSSQTDLYSLGATLYHLLCGKTPFEGATPADVVRSRLIRPATPINSHRDDLSQATQQLVMRMLDPDPSRRFPDADSVAVEIRVVLKHLEPPARPPKEKEETEASARNLRAPVRRRRSDYVVLSVVALLEGLVMVHAVYVNAAASRSSRERRGGGGYGTAPRMVPVLSTASSGSVEASVSPGSTGGALPVDAAAAFTQRLTPEWSSVSLGKSISRGSTMWQDGTLLVQGEGFDLARGRDDCRYVYANVLGNFAFAAHVKTVGTTHPQAKSGLLVRSTVDERGPSLFFGVLGNGTLLLQVREPDGNERQVSVTDDKVFLPTSLRLVRTGGRFAAETSPDGVHWEPFDTCELSLPRQVRVGLAVASRVRGTLATAEFTDLDLRIPPASSNRRLGR